MKKIIPFAITMVLVLLMNTSYVSAGEKPNILIITMDTLRADHVRTYDTKRGVTQYVDQIGLQGIVFTRAFTHVPLTLPSHVSLFTGLTPLHHGVHDNAGFRLKQEVPTMAYWLKKAGYHTAAFIGAFPLDRRFGLDHGFDVYDEGYPTRPSVRGFQPERPARAVVDRSLAWLKNHSTASWFLWLHVYDPHAPYRPPAYCSRKYPKQPYAGEVACADHELGRILEYLETSGLRENTMIIFLADHGEALGDHGEDTHGLFIYNETVHIPLMMTIPGQSGHRVINKMVAISDIFPTVLDYLDLPVPKRLDGHSLMPLIFPSRARQSMPQYPIYLESLHVYLNRGWAPVIGLIWRGYKYIDTPIPEFYHLQKDFKEQHNLKEPRLVKESLKRKLKKMMGHLEINRSDENAETVQLLRSLGYLSTGAAPKPRTFTPEDDPKRLLPLHRMLNTAVEKAGAGDYRTAIDLLKKIIQGRPDMMVAYHYLAEYYDALGDILNTERTFQLAIRQFPDQVSFLSQYGIFLARTGRFERAYQILKNALNRDPTNTEAWNHLGIVAWKLGKTREAIHAYQRALKIDPADPMVMVNMGNLYLDQGAIESAEKWFVRALQLDPALPSAYNGLGAVRLKQGRPDEAIKLWKKGLSYDPDHELLLWNLGKTLYDLNRRREARGYLLRYLERYGSRLKPDEYFTIEQWIKSSNP